MLRIFSAGLGSAGWRQKTAGKQQKAYRQCQKERSTSYCKKKSLTGNETEMEPGLPVLIAKLVYVQMHSVPSRACQCSQPSHFGPVAPGRHVQNPVTGSQGTGIEPWGSHSHSWQEPPGLLGLPV